MMATTALELLFYALGGSVSPGKNNDELIDHLIDAEFIRTPTIQRIFRSVDRGNYYLPSHRQNAYKDIAWRMGNLHLSAPCVYSVVMESLKLKAGLSFLNIGSGSGYLNTMAGLLLGPYGINHGIEIHQDIVEYAYERLDEFMKSSKVVDENDFCEPVFTCGNCLTLDSQNQQYDRVYCGAACPEEYEGYIKNLVKVNGILVMPLNDKLLKITRLNETDWSEVKVLSVSFAPLLVPSPTKKGEVIEDIKLGDFKPPTLQQLCRFKVRSYLRDNIETEHPKLINIRKKLPSRRSAVKLFIVNCTGEDDYQSESDSDDLDSFSLLMRSMHHTNFLLQNYSHVDGLSTNDQNEESEGEGEEIEEALKFASLTTVRDAVEEKVENNEEVVEKKSSNTKGEEMQVSDSLSESEKCKKSNSVSSEVEGKKSSETTCTSSETSEGRAKSLRIGKIQESIPKSGNDLSNVENDADVGSSETKNKLDACVEQNSSPSSSYSLPPSQSTRSRTNTLKRKHSSTNDGPSTSDDDDFCSPVLKKFYAAKKRREAEAKRPTDGDSQYFVKLDSNNKVAEEFSHSYFLAQKITALPLPAYLRRYVNYERDNI